MRINITTLHNKLLDDERMLIDIEPKLQVIELLLTKWSDDSKKNKKILHYIAFEELDNFDMIFMNCLTNLRKYQ